MQVCVNHLVGTSHAPCLFNREAEGAGHFTAFLDFKCKQETDRCDSALTFSITFLASMFYLCLIENVCLPKKVLCLLEKAPNPKYSHQA